MRCGALANRTHVELQPEEKPPAEDSGNVAKNEAEKNDLDEDQARAAAEKADDAADCACLAAEVVTNATTVKERDSAALDAAEAAMEAPAAADLAAEKAEEAAEAANQATIEARTLRAKGTSAASPGMPAGSGSYQPWSSHDQPWSGRDHPWRGTDSPATPSPSPSPTSSLLSILLPSFSATPGGVPTSSLRSTRGSLIHSLERDQLCREQCGARQLVRLADLTKQVIDKTAAIRVAKQLECQDGFPGGILFGHQSLDRSPERAAVAKAWVALVTRVLEAGCPGSVLVESFAKRHGGCMAYTLLWVAEAHGLAQDVWQFFCTALHDPLGEIVNLEDVKIIGQQLFNFVPPRDDTGDLHCSVCLELSVASRHRRNAGCAEQVKALEECVKSLGWLTVSDKFAQDMTADRTSTVGRLEREMRSGGFTESRAMELWPCSR